MAAAAEKAAGSWGEFFAEAAPRVRAALAEAPLAEALLADASGSLKAAAAAVWGALRVGAPPCGGAGPAERRAAARRLATLAVGPCGLAPGAPVPREKAEARAACLWIVVAKLAEDLFEERAAGAAPL
jgi:hypothetical protein